MTLRRKISILIVVLVAIIGVFFYVNNRILYSHGKAQGNKIFIVEKGENAVIVGQKLQKAGLISNKVYFLIYLWKEDKLHSMVAGIYEINSSLTIPEIVKVISGGEVKDNRIGITFKEGVTAEQIRELLIINGLDGDGFSKLVKNPSLEILSQFEFLTALPAKSSLEGYLFPDTYYFAKDASADDVLKKMLKNFDLKLTDQMRTEIKSQSKTINQIIIMASIVEKEAGFNSEMNMVSSVFWNRLAIGQRLQSDATLEYVLGTNAFQHSIEQTKTQSPYNTYQVSGLPPGPVSNPGIAAINAAIYPEKSNFLYFLTDPKTKKTIFAETFEQHVANKDKYGL